MNKSVKIKCSLIHLLKYAIHQMLNTFFDCVGNQNVTRNDSLKIL